MARSGTLAISMDQACQSTHVRSVAHAFPGMLHGWPKLSRAELIQLPSKLSQSAQRQICHLNEQVHTHGKPML